MSKTIEVRNPRTGKYDYVIIPPPAKLLAQQCHRIRRAQKNWQELGIGNRAIAIKQWKKEILANKDKILEALIIDTGRLAISELELDLLINNIDRWCNLAPKILEDTTTETGVPFITLQQTAVPYPLVGVISPWNFPLLLAMINTIPALLAGCAVIVKPSEIAPRFVAPLVNSLSQIPHLKDVLNFVEGAGETGADLIDNVDMVCFTGRIATGKKVAQAAAKRFIPACLELAAKNPAIVLESADLELAASAIVWGAVFNSGQSCSAIARIYVAQSILEEFIAKLVTKAKRLQLAYPNLESGDIGPIISEKQAAIISDHLLDARDLGAVLHCGGEIEDYGGAWWCRPTVLSQVNHDMKVMTEETFAPILPVMAFSDISQGIELANDSIYGLSAAIFAGSDTQALEVAQQINAGAISINDAALTTLIHEGENNAFNFSGMGNSATGAAGLTRFLRKKAFLVKNQPINDPWWFNNLSC
ncbi:aldehyde dehydrogenase family protein [Calothrix sp. 336/3]|uniref:aldehyde dehydrogenase family protein n=1 Tax=Calothrix sp. 336/3 TaxID=1337936 RepID=UPI0004E30807|nr:aldehyde dehydrogenase family protein [Calothrix sp. 336/3]AKG24335.1 aldehyde dehydrogenase [Calothrix sp. 336/3]